MDGTDCKHISIQSDQPESCTPLCKLMVIAKHAAVLQINDYISKSKGSIDKSQKIL